tara:strand:+ start:133 stop:1161 length:1029 start_codon:yes stop_codon:yes gene_type:complete
MPTISATTHPTLLDYTKRQDPDKSIATIVETLAQTNEVLEDMVHLEGNMETGHRTTVRSGLPAPTWRKLYGGVQPTKSETVQVTDTIGMMEAYAEVDKQLADLNGNTAAFRMSEDMAHLEGMNQEFADTLFYGDETSASEEFTGFLPRFNSLSAESSENILLDTNFGGASASGTDNTSLYLIVWGPNTCHGIYSKGSQMGLSKEDKGQVTVEDVVGDGTGGRMEAYRTHYKWCCGLSVRDWRYIVRMQIDSTNLGADPATSGVADITQMMSDACELIPSLSAGRAAFYCNRKVKQALRKQFVTKVKQSTLSMDEIGGMTTLTFDGIPIRKVDALRLNEARIS